MMEKSNLVKIITNNLIVLGLQVVWIGLILTGIFDSLYSSDSGAMISMSGGGIVFSGFIASILIAYVVSYKRYEGKKKLWELTKYFFLSILILPVLVLFLFFQLLFIDGMSRLWFFLVSSSITLLLFLLMSFVATMVAIWKGKTQRGVK